MMELKPDAYMSTPKEELIGNNQGQSLVEILIALAVFSITITATTLVFFGGQNFSANALNTREAIQKTHDASEALRILRDTNWNSLTNGTHGLQFTNDQWSLTASSDWSNGYKRSVVISTDANGIKQLDTTVAWNVGSEGTKSMSITETLTPPNQGLSGDWQQPCVVGDADGTSGAKGTDVFYANQKAYVSSSAVAQNKEDLFIFNVTDPDIPTLTGSLNLEEGWKSLTVSGSYVFGIEEDSSDFFVVDATNPSSPVQIAKLALGGGKGRYVMARNGYVYATTASSSAGPEFFSIDVRNPTSPTIASSLEFGVDINEVSVLQHIAYLATGGNSQELVLVDINIPSTPTQLGSYDAPGTADARAVHAKSSKRIYLGRNSSTEKELLILDASTPASVTLRGSQDISGSVYSLLTAGTIAFLGTDDTNEEFQNYYIRDPAAIVKYGGKNLSNIGTGAAYYNNIVYMSVRNVDILQLISAPINGICGG